MSRPRRGRRSTRNDHDQMMAEIRKATEEWNALPLEERMIAGRKHVAQSAYTPAQMSGDAPSSFFLWHTD